MLDVEIESYFEHLRLGREPGYLAHTYYFWKKTEEELESATKVLQERRSDPFRLRFYRNGTEEFAESIEPFEFNCAGCIRVTYKIENKPFCSTQ